MRLTFSEIEYLAFKVINKDKDPVLYEKFIKMWASLKGNEYNNLIIVEGENAIQKCGKYN